MTTYTDVFGGDAVPPSQNGYAAVALTADTTFFWPELASGSNLIADIMEVTPDAAWSMTFPAANVVSTGRDVLVRNLGSDTITLKDSAGGTIGTVAAGVSKYLYITDNSTVAGLWTVFTFGTGTSAADAATLAGYGLVATGSTLSQQYTVTSTGVTTTVSTTTDRARTIVFTNSGTVTCNLPSAASAGNGFFVNISNQGTGTVTLDGSGSETIDGETTKDLAPGESCTVVCNAVLWASIGYGRSTQFQFTKLVLDISTGTPFTLSSVQASNKLIQTIGTITGAVVINVPAVVAVYYIQCSHTGAFSTTFKTAAGAGVALSAGDRSILYCDGVDVVAAQTATAPAANLSGGSAGVVVYQSSAGITSFTAAGSAGEILLSGGTGVPTWSAGTGSGVPVRATSATLVTPNLGTPASGTLTNCTGLPQAGTVGLTTADSPQFTGINLGHASDTTLTRVSAGVVAVEGSNVLLASGLGSITQAYDADIPTVSASQGEMEAGTEAALRSMSPLRVAQAIAALVPASSSAPTGSVFDYVGSTEPSGYVFLSGKTIGNGSSGGTARANADTSALFTLLWDSMTNAEAPVSSGRGANAAADFAANKTITLPDARGRTIAGKDNMGGSTASRLTNGGSGITGTTLGVSGGTETHTLTEAQLASHGHSFTIGDQSTPGSVYATATAGAGAADTLSGATTGSGNVATNGSGSAHQNTQPTLVLNKIIKL